MEKYIHNLGMLLSDVRVDYKGRIFILVEGHDDKGEFVYEPVYLPEEFQTAWNVDIIKDNYKSHE